MKEKTLSARLARFGRISSTALVTTLGAACVLPSADTNPTAPAPYAPAPTPQNHVNVNITFVDGCPIGVTPDPVIAAHPQKIHWQSVNPAGSAIAADYRVIYDPFVGNKFDSDASGLAKSTPISNNVVPGVIYKYSIAATTCQAILDPRIIVN